MLGALPLSLAFVPVAQPIISVSAIAHRPYECRHAPAVLVEDDFDYDRDWAKNIFSAKNAAPWLVLTTVLGFEIYNALVPVEEMPPLLQTVIPTVLGSQYQRPPPGA